MLYNSMNEHSKPNILTFNKPIIFHFFPDFGYDIFSLLEDDTGINFNNLQGVVIKKENMRLGQTFLNTNILYKELKEKLEDHHKVLLYNFYPSDIHNNKILIVDHSSVCKLIESYNEINKKKATEYLISYLKDELIELKLKFPNIENAIFFYLKNKDGIIKNLNQLKTIRDIKFFDKYSWLIINNTILNLTFYNKEGIAELNSSNLLRTNAFLKEIKINLSTNIKNKLDKISSKIEVKTNLTNNDLELNITKLDKSLNSIKLTNGYVLDNISAAVKSNLNANKNLTNEDVSSEILSAANRTIFNNKNIKELYKNDPNKLLLKLQNVNTAKVDLLFPTSKNNVLINPEQIIKLKEITGPVRHKYEFSENIDFNVSRLFKVLESKSNPIKIISIDKEIKDNDLERYAEYVIKIKNLNGGYKDSYEIKLRIPTLINDKYFKLNGKEYIISSQQFLNPITKDKPSEVRFLTNYNMIRLRLRNFKFTPSEVDSIINMINNKYSRYVFSYEPGKLVFKTGQIIDLNNNELPYTNNDSNNLESLKLVKGKYYIFKNNINTGVSIGRNEFLFEKINMIIPDINLKVSKKSLQYIQAYVMGAWLPLIVYFWQQLGLIEALTRFSLDYSIGESEELKGRKLIKLELEDDILYIYPENKKEEYIANGLLQIQNNLKHISKNELTDKTSCYSFLYENYGNSIIEKFDGAAENMIDPITEDLLNFEDQPTNLLDNLAGPCMDKLFNDKADHPSDLKTLRSRQSEYLMHLLYNEIMMAHKKYSDSLKFNETDAKIKFDDSYLIKHIMGKHSHAQSSGGSIIDYVNPFSPVDELMKASKVVKTGRGGLPTKRAAKKEHRNIHESYIGSIAANSTSESADVGLVNHHTLGVLLSNKYGQYGENIGLAESDNLKSLGIDEALTPLVNEMDSVRAMLARTHTTQKIPIIYGEPALIESGAEYIVPQLASEKFCIKAKENGTVTKIENEILYVTYDDGIKECFDISPRYSATKRNSTIQLTFNSLKVNDKFTKNEILSWSKAFSGNVLANGKNSKIAILNYIGASHEDGYVVTDSMTNDFSTEMVTKIPVIVPPNTKLINIIDSKNASTEQGDVLIEFQYANTSDDYLELFDILDEDFEEETEGFYKSNNKSMKILSPGGEIANITIKLNSKDSLDPIIIEKWKGQLNVLRYKIKSLRQNSTISSIDNIDTSVSKVGNHKFKGKFFEGALIEFYIKRIKPIEIGDKISNRYGAKGVVTKIIPSNLNPYGEFIGNIDCFLAPASILGRKNFVILKELYLGKIIHFLQEQVRDAFAKKEDIKEIKNLILKVYTILDSTKDKRIVKAIEKCNLTPDMRFNLIIPPFTSITFENINLAAKAINIPLDERVFIPELNCWTKTPVPCGYSYIGKHEQLSEDYESTRSMAGYVGATGQPVKGKTKLGGQAIGNLDVYSLLTYNVNNLLNELMTVRSDNFVAKNKVLMSLRQNGVAYLTNNTKSGVTQDTFKYLMLGMGLNISGKF